MVFEVKLIESFLFGLLAPLTATCIIPLYPAFIAFLAGKGTQKKTSMLLLGILVSLGIITFITLLGLIFTTILEFSLTTVIGIVSPIAFGLLAIVSILMIIGVDFGRVFRTLKVPESKNPKVSAYLYGLFFGAIIIPCNPAIIALFFTRTSQAVGFIGNMFSFLVFAIGMAVPLLVIALLADKYSTQILRFFGKHNRKINVIAGLIMLGISIYYLVFVFGIFG